MASARYNGIRAPLLPEFDTVAYPHVFVLKASSAYTLYALSNMVNVTGDYDQIIFNDLVKCRTWTTPKDYSDGNTWTADSTYESTDEMITLRNCIWSNTTLYKDTGAVFIEGSEPIINADESFQLGIAVGMGLKGW